MNIQFKEKGQPSPGGGKRNKRTRIGKCWCIIVATAAFRIFILISTAVFAVLVTTKLLPCLLACAYTRRVARDGKDRIASWAIYRFN